MALTEAQLTKLREHVIAEDPVGYYNQIAEWGVVDATLVPGVLLGKTLPHDH